MKKILIGLTFLFSLSVFAQTPAELAKLAEGMKLDKTQVSNMIDMMVKMGKISKEDAKKAKQELGNYSAEDMQALQHQAIEKMKNSKQGTGGAGSILPTQGQQLAAPIINQKSPASSDAPSKSESKSGSSFDEPGYKEALDYLNQ
jgi:polyhydroxyalkanoate synthesis regulator phasin